MTANPEIPLELRVDGIRALSPQIIALRLCAADGSPLPGFTPGSHVQVEVAPGGMRQWRHYSLVNFDIDGHATQAPDAYLIAVRREDQGRGGSRWLHTEVRAGDILRVLPPQNDFPMTACRDAVLIAGGIGVTPLTAMATALAAAGHDFSMHYSGRSIAQLAFTAELRALAAERLHLYGDDDPAHRLALPRLLAALRPTQPLYVCGPKGMIDAVISQASALGWAREDIHVELFTTAEPRAGDAGFEVELRQSGVVLSVRPEQTILDAMLDAGLDPLYDCKRGECGVCQTAVLEGAVEHRDYCLSEREKQAGQVMQICVSRARGTRLVLDA